MSVLLSNNGASHNDYRDGEDPISSCVINNRFFDTMVLTRLVSVTNRNGVLRSDFTVRKGSCGAVSTGTCS